MAVNIQYPDKRQRAYIFRFGISPIQYKEVSYPLTIEFSIIRNHLASSNEAEFTIYNLNSESREQIIHDSWDLTTRKGVQFYGGYVPTGSGMLPRCFNGVAREAYSVRQGSEWRTHIKAYDGAESFELENVSLTINKNTTEKNMIKMVMANFKTYSKSTIGFGFNNTKKRASSFFGNPVDVINDISRGNFFIDDGNVYVLDKNEVVTGDVVKISPENGLIGTPRYFEKKVEIEMIFEPRLKPAQLIQLDSSGANRFDGFYKITGISHQGIISEAVGGEAVTKVTMMKIPDAIVVPDDTPNSYKLYGSDPLNVGAYVQ